MSDVATASAGDFYLLEHLAAFFEEENPCARAQGFGSGDGSEISGRTAPDDNEVVAFGGGGGHWGTI